MSTAKEAQPNQDNENSPMERTNVRKRANQRVKVKKEVHKNSFSLNKSMRLPVSVKVKVSCIYHWERKVSSMIDCG